MRRRPEHPSLRMPKPEAVRSALPADMDPRPGHEGELLMAHGGCGKPNPAPFVTDCRAGVTHSKVPKFHRSPCDQFHNQLGESKGFNQPWTAVEGHLLLANTSWAAPQTNSNPGFCFAGWSDSPHPGPNASLLVFKAGPQGSAPLRQFLGRGGRLVRGPGAAVARHHRPDQGDRHSPQPFRGRLPLAGRARVVPHALPQLQPGRRWRRGGWACFRAPPGRAVV